MLLSRPPLTARRRPVRLACFRHAASVYPEPGSNSPSELPKTRTPSAIALDRCLPTTLRLLRRLTPNRPPDRSVVQSAARTFSIRPAFANRQVPLEPSRAVPRGQKTQAPRGDLGVSASAHAACPPPVLPGTSPCCSPVLFVSLGGPPPRRADFLAPPRWRPVLATPLW